MSQKEAFEFNLTELDRFTKPIEMDNRFNMSRVGPNGFFARLDFGAGFTGTVKIWLGPKSDKLTHITDLDMQITTPTLANNPCTYDIATRANWMQLEIDSGGPAFTCEAIINR